MHPDPRSIHSVTPEIADVEASAWERLLSQATDMLTELVPLKLQLADRLERFLTALPSIPASERAACCLTFTDILFLTLLHRSENPLAGPALSLGSAVGTQSLQQIVMEVRKTVHALSHMCLVTRRGEGNSHRAFVLRAPGGRRLAVHWRISGPGRNEKFLLRMNREAVNDAGPASAAENRSDEDEVFEKTTLLRLRDFVSVCRSDLESAIALLDLAGRGQYCI